MNGARTRYLRSVLGAAALLLVGFEVVVLVLFPRIGEVPSASPSKKVPSVRPVTANRGSDPDPIKPVRVKPGDTAKSFMPGYGAIPLEGLLRLLPPEDARLLLQNAGQEHPYNGATKYFSYGNAWTGEEGPIVLVSLNGVQLHPDPDELYGKTPKISADKSLSGAMTKQVIDAVFAALEKRGTTAEQASQELVEQLYEQAKASLEAKLGSTQAKPAE